MDTVKTTIHALKLAEPATHGGLTVFPLTSEGASTLRYILLEEGLRKESGHHPRGPPRAGSVPELKVENRAGLPVLIVDGEGARRRQAGTGSPTSPC